ncbi:uncharacterized protein LOC123540623 isoform X2 [Mercenaria mercenaria]|nr:uncharacterized protein LOC123540623 isoform X2 [Mercenaria mercenaria]
MTLANKGIHIIVEDSKHCTPCKKAEKKVASFYYCTDCEAYYCEPCFEFHTRIPLLEKHIVLKGTDIDVWASLPYKCKAHDKNYEFFCGEHESLCCHICVSLQHRSCTDMEYIPEKAKNICTKSEFREMKQNTEQEMKEIKQFKSRFQNKTEMSRQSKETFIKSLKEQRALINGLFDSLEKITLDYMDKKLKNNNIYINQANTEITIHEHELSRLKQQLDSASSEKEVLVFICLKRGENLLADMKQKLSKLDASTCKDDFQLVIHPEIERFVQNLPDLGCLQDEQTRQDAASDTYPKKICLICGRQVDRKCHYCS